MLSNALQSNQVKRTPQVYIIELKYWNIEPASRSKNTANGYNVQKNQFTIDFQND